MNAGAAKACRADRKLRMEEGWVKSAKVPRDMKRAWAQMNAKERGRIHRQWKLAQRLRAERGEARHQQHLAALREAGITADTDAF